VLTKCRGWIVTSSCRTYHHNSLPSRIAVGDTITISFGSHPNEFGFSVARIDLKGQHCAIFSKAEGDRHLDKINVAPCYRADEGRWQPPFAGPTIFSARSASTSAAQMPGHPPSSSALLTVRIRATSAAAGDITREPQIRRLDDPLSQVTVMRGQCPRVGAGPAAAARAQLLLLD
jgi:hypothetical protein